MALITAAEARVYLRGLSGTGEDTDLATMIARADQMIATYLGYPPAAAGGNATIESATYTRYYTGCGGRDLQLDVWPVTSITSIEDDSATGDFDGSTYLVTAADYGSGAFRGEIGVVRYTSTSGEAWSTSEDAIKVVFVAGYATVPTWAEHAAAQLLQHLWTLRSRQGKATSSRSGRTATFTPETLPDHIAVAIAPHMLPRAMA